MIFYATCLSRLPNISNVRRIEEHKQTETKTNKQTGK